MRKRSFVAFALPIMVVSMLMLAASGKTKGLSLRYVKSFAVQGQAAENGQGIREVLEDIHGRILVLARNSRQVFIYGANMRAEGHLGRSDSLWKGFRSPIRMVMGVDGRIYVLDIGLSEILIFSSDEVFIRAVPIPHNPWAFTVDDKGNFYVGYLSGPSLFVKLDSTGRVLKLFGHPFETGSCKGCRAAANAAHLCFDEENQMIIVALFTRPVVWVFNEDCDLVDSFRIRSPNVTAIDQAGENTNTNPAFFNIYTWNVSALGGNIFLLLSKDPNTQRSVLSVCTFHGSTIVDLPISYSDGAPALNPTHCSFGANGEIIFSSRFTDSILFYKLLTK